MDTMRNLYKMLAIIFLMQINIASPPANAQDAEVKAKLPEQVKFYGYYSFTWGGIKLGKLALGIEEDKSSYKVYLSVTSAGLVNLFTRHVNSTEARGKHDAKGYHPTFYESNYQTKKKPRHIRLQYDGKGNVTEVFNDPPEDRAKRPEVPAGQSKDSYDPLTGVMLMRSGILNFRGFDVKRLYEVTAVSEGTETVTALGRDIEAEKFSLSRKPLAGMTEKETKEYAEGEPTVYFYFSNDVRRVPVYMSMPMMFGSVKGVLTRECATWDECKVN
jgi:hypothetical protein